MRSDPSAFLDGYVRNLGAGSAYRSSAPAAAPQASPFASSLRLRRPESDDRDAFGSSDASSLFNAGVGILQGSQSNMENLMYGSYNARKAAERARKSNRAEASIASTNSLFGLANNLIDVAGTAYSYKHQPDQRPQQGSKGSDTRESGWA